MDSAARSRDELVRLLRSLADEPLADSSMPDRLRSTADLLVRADGPALEAADAELGRALAGADSVRSPDGTALDEPVDSWERGPLAALRRELHRTTKGA